MRYCYDVIVSGLGPGGATAAWELGRSGLSVLAIDKKSFPRYKPCGGGLSARIQNLLEPDFRATVDTTIRSIRFCYPGRKSFSVHSGEPIAYMVKRERFDHFLALKAKHQGVDVREADGIVKIQERDDGVEVTTASTRYRGKYLVGADGAHSLIARHLNPRSHRRRILALEEEVPMEEEPPDQCGEEVLIDLGSAPGGYAWRFPKTRCLSVGVAGFNGQQRLLLGQFADFKTSQDLADLAGRCRTLGHPIPIFDPGNVKLASGRIVLVGDAANLVDPFLGEGIYYAIRSGQIAARTVAQAVSGEIADCTRYQERIARDMYPEFLAAEKIARISYAFPQLWYEAMQRYPEVTRWFYEILQGSASYPGLVSRVKSQVGRILKKGLTEKIGALFQKVLP